MNGVEGLESWTARTAGSCAGQSYGGRCAGGSGWPSCALEPRRARRSPGIRECGGCGAMRARDAGQDCRGRRAAMDAGRRTRKMRLGRGSLVHVRHKVGPRSCRAMARILVLRDGMGARIGTAVVFHPAESLDALPHGETWRRIRVCSRARRNWKTGWRQMHEDFCAERYAAWRAVGHRRPGARIAQDARRAGLRGDAGEGGAHAGDGLSRPKRSGAGATMSFWFCRTSAARRCWRRTRRCWRAWRGRRTFAGGATAYRSR